MTIDDYIADSPEAVRPILEKIRRVIREAAPGATEVISYRMPAFKGRGILIYFAAFTAHIGLFPPVSGDAAIERAIAPYRCRAEGESQVPADSPDAVRPDRPDRPVARGAGCGEGAASAWPPRRPPER